MDWKPVIQQLCADKRSLEMVRYLVNHSYIRVVNYHNTDPQDAARIEREVDMFSRTFSPVTIADMDRFFQTGTWDKSKPGLIPAVFEGFRNHVDVMYPILEAYGFTGWFYIPSFFPDVPESEQLTFSEAHELTVTRPENYADARYAMNWDEVRKIAQRHEICCHTGNHFQITQTTSDEDMYREIVLSKRKLESEIGRSVDVFCWLYGEEYHYNVRAQKFLQEAGYRYVVSNLKIEKIR